MKHCTVFVVPANTSSEGQDVINLNTVDKVVLDNLTITANTKIFNPDALNAALIHSYGGTTNTIISNCILKNATNNAICFENAGLGVSSGVVIQNCNVEQSVKGILLDSVTSLEIENCKVQECTNTGIQLTNCTSISLLNNIINNVTGSGILLDANSVQNNLQNNTVFSNNIGINNLGGSTNQFINNLAYNNTTNYVGVTNVGAPGSVPTLGENISA